MVEKLETMESSLVRELMEEGLEFTLKMVSLDSIVVDCWIVEPHTH